MNRIRKAAFRGTLSGLLLKGLWQRTFHTAIARHLKPVTRMCKNGRTEEIFQIQELPIQDGQDGVT
jgi:hypothetical protein